MAKDNLVFWLEKYFDKFGDYFPTENFSSSDPEVLIGKIKHCIDIGLSFEELDVRPSDTIY